MSNALVVVDVQSFFLVAAPSALVTRIVDHINGNNYDEIIFTVFRNNPTSNLVRSLGWSKCSNDEDVILPPEFEAYIKDDNVFFRNTYSGFSGTALDDYLKAKHIDKVTLCGVDTDACVLATAFSAFDLGYKVDVEFAITYSNGELENEARSILQRSIIAKD